MRSACIRTGTLGLLLLFAAGCAALSDPLGRLDALDIAQQQYTEAIRWGYLDRARTFIAPERRAAFEQLEPVFQAIRFTDFEIGEIEGDKNEAQVTVTYRGYAHATQIEHTFREQQHWKRTDGLGNQWRVQSDLSEQVLALLGPNR